MVTRGRIPPLTRRALLRAAGLTLAIPPIAGSTGLFGGTDGTRTPTLTPASIPDHRVMVGSDGFDPESVRAPPGATVVWEWTSDGHNIVVMETPEGSDWEGHEAVETTGFAYEHTFEIEGTYWYHWGPHASDHPDARVVITTGTPTPTESGIVDVRGRDEVTVTVGPGGELVFDPDAVRISVGATVTWKWDSDNHNIVVGSQPPEAGWEGHELVENEGFAYRHTFSVAGRYEYWCRPHRSVGMEGTVFVE